MTLISKTMEMITESINSILWPLYSFFNDTIGINDLTVSTALAILVLYTPLTYLVVKLFTSMYSPGKAVLIETFLIVFITAFMFDNDPEKHIRIVSSFLFVTFVISNIYRVMLEPTFSGVLGRDKE